ncbi:hypothetical protein [Hippea alviniae]|nr:hypothetical protein [Hippea alviniae]
MKMETTEAIKAKDLEIGFWILTGIAQKFAEDMPFSYVFKKRKKQ